jgi:glycosyltransferase involved in cell wall biosynthesis
LKNKELCFLGINYGNEVPAISVITIVKNNEELLPRAVDSVLGQGFTDFEHIIVNDGSTDGTIAIIDEYAAKVKRVKPLHMVQNVGRAMARNKGIDAARGKYLFFLDSDDYLPNTALMDLYEVAEQDNADIVYGRIKSFDPLNGRWIDKHYTDPLISPEQHNFLFDDKLDLVNDHSIIGRLYRLEMLVANNISFSTVRKNGEDVLFSFYAAFYAKRLTTLPEKTVYFYNAGNYMATANEAKIFDARDNVLETLEFALRNGSPGLQRRMRRKAAMFASILNRAQKVYEGQDEKIIKFIETLAPLVAGLPDNILQKMPAYNRRFTKALIQRRFDEAYIAWKEQNTLSNTTSVRNNISIIPETTLHLNKNASTTFDLQIEGLSHENKMLADQLDRLYNTLSWRITLPLRCLRRLILRLSKIIRRGSNEYSSF